MPESINKTVWEGDAGKLLSAMSKIVEKYKEVNGEVKNFGKHGQESGDMVDDALGKAANSAKNFIMGFATVGGVIASIKSLVDQMKEIISLRNEMFQTALSVEQIGLKIANLRGDVSKAGMDKVVKDLENISLAGRVSPKIVGGIMESAEATLGPGTPAAMAASINMAKLYGPAGLTNEGDILPKIFKTANADTSEKQLKILNEIIAAQGGSTVKLGDFLQNYGSVLITDLRKQFTLEQSLAKYSAAMTTSATAGEAATMDEEVTRLLSTPSLKGFKYLKSKAHQQGMDFIQMESPERLAFAQQLYGQFQTKEEKEKFRLAVAPRGGWNSVEGMFSETGQAAAADTKSRLNKVIDNYVENRIKNFEEVLTAKSIESDIAKMFDETKVTGKVSATVLLEAAVKNKWRTEHAGAASNEEFIKMWANVKEIEQFREQRSILRQNLGIAYEKAPAGRKEYIQDLYTRAMGMGSATLNPQLIQEISDVTGNFQLQRQTGRTINPNLFQKAVINPQNYEYGAISMEDRKLSAVAADDLKENTKALNRLSRAIEDSNLSSIGPNIEIPE